MTKEIAEFPKKNFTILTTLKHPVLTKRQTTKTLSAIKQEILGDTYELSLVFVGTKRSRTLNRQWRGKDRPTDILSFPHESGFGEMFICPEIAKKKASDYGRDHERFLIYLFIHGCFHLIGMEHGSKMEENEDRIRRRFAV